jgi:nitrogen fixation NifU-like protein
MDDLYREEILDHYEHPHRHGTLEAADISIGDNNPSCGDRINIDVKLSPDRTLIAEIAFSGDGCVISQAATSMLMDAVVGMPLEEVERLDRHAVLDLLGVQLTPTRVKCAVLGLKVLQAGLYRYLVEHQPIDRHDVQAGRIEGIQWITPECVPQELTPSSMRSER